MITPILETERFILRPLTIADASAVFDGWAQDPEVARFMRWNQHQSIEETKEWLTAEEVENQGDDSYSWGFVLKQNQQLVGSGGLVYSEQHQLYEIGYNLMHQYWGQGLVTEAATRIVSFAKDELGIKQIFAVHADDNPASGRVLEKCGFIYQSDGTYSSFDGSRTFPAKEYLLEVSGPPAPLPEWKVSFEGGFWSRHSKGKAGTELVISRKFLWNNETWCVPSIYLCAKGLVVDFCVQIPAERIQDFMDRWSLTAESDETEFTEEQQLQLQAENPLDVHFTPELQLNGITMSFSHGSGMSWNPCLAEDTGPEIQNAMRHYELDPTDGWLIWRSSFPWVKKRILLINSLALSLKRELVAVPGMHFVVSSPGDQILFPHPITGLQHTLTVQEYEQQEFPDDAFRDSNFVFPTHYRALTYTLYPDLTDREFTVTDCVSSDPSKPKNPSPNGPNSCSSAAFGIIGSADGPTTILYGDNRSKLHATCSALHFKPVSQVEWRMIFREKRCEDTSIILIES